MVNSQLNTAATSTQNLAAIAMAAPVSQVQTMESLITTEAQAKGVDPILANKIAFCESTTRQFDKNGQVLRGVENSADVGLFQINEEYHLKKSQELGFDIHTTQGNIDYAMWLIKHEGSRHWKASQKCWAA